MADKTQIGLEFIARQLGENPNISANAIVKALRGSGLAYSSRQGILADIRAFKGVEAKSPVVGDAARRGGLRSGAARYEKAVEKEVRKLESLPPDKLPPLNPKRRYPGGRPTPRQEAISRLRLRRNEAARAGDIERRRAYDYQLLRQRAQEQGHTIPRNATSFQILALMYERDDENELEFDELERSL